MTKGTLTIYRDNEIVNVMDIPNCYQEIAKRFNEARDYPTHKIKNWDYFRDRKTLKFDYCFSQVLYDNKTIKYIYRYSFSNIEL